METGLYYIDTNDLIEGNIDSVEKIDKGISFERSQLISENKVLFLVLSNNYTYIPNNNIIEHTIQKTAKDPISIKNKHLLQLMKNIKNKPINLVKPISTSKTKEPISERRYGYNKFCVGSINSTNGSSRKQEKKDYYLNNTSLSSGKRKRTNITTLYSNEPIINYNQTKIHKFK